MEHKELPKKNPPMSLESNDKTGNSEPKKKGEKRSMTNSMKNSSSSIQNNEPSTTKKRTKTADIDSKEAGRDEYLELARNLCKDQNAELDVIGSKAKTGSTYMSQKKYDFLLNIFSVIDRFKKADNEAQADMKIEYESALASMKGAWKYQFRLKWYGDSPRIQRPSSFYKSKKNKPNSAALKFKEMEESDWRDAVPVDSEECFKILNDLHWKSNCNRDHHKHFSLFKLTSEIDFSHNVTSKICGLISEACPICKASNVNHKKKNSRLQKDANKSNVATAPTVMNNSDTTNSTMSQVQAVGNELSVVQYGITRLPKTARDEESPFLFVMAIAFCIEPKKVELVPILNGDIVEICGGLINSFVRNGFPKNLQFVNVCSELEELHSRREDILSFVNRLSIPGSLIVKTSVESVSTIFIQDTVHLLQKAFAYLSTIELFTYSHVVLAYVTHAINNRQVLERDDSGSFFLETYLSVGRLLIRFFQITREVFGHL